MTFVDPRRDPCPACGKTVPYAKGRRSCIDCKVWMHEECGVNPFRKDGKIFCKGCSRKHAREIVKNAAHELNGSTAHLPSLEVLIWSIWFDQDEEAMSRELGIPAEEVRRVAKAYLEDGVWKGGKVRVSFGKDAGGFEIGIAIMIASLVADGLIERVGMTPHLIMHTHA